MFSFVSTPVISISHFYLSFSFERSPNRVIYRYSHRHRQRQRRLIASLDVQHFKRFKFVVAVAVVVKILSPSSRYHFVKRSHARVKGTYRL